MKTSSDIAFSESSVAQKPALKSSVGERAEMAYLLGEMFGDPSGVCLVQFERLLNFASERPELDKNRPYTSPGEFLTSWLQDMELLLDSENPLSLDESVYKAWTKQKSHPLSGATGRCFGDPAAHMLAVLESFGLSLETGQGRSPDSLSTLFEFLGFLLENRPSREVGTFCHDHLDWVDELEQCASRLNAGKALLEVISLATVFIHETVDEMEKFDG